MGVVTQVASVSPSSSISSMLAATGGIVLERLSLNSKMYRSLFPRSPWSVEEQMTLASSVAAPEVVSMCANEAGSVIEGVSGSNRTRIGDAGPN